jgi:hypothetical protein
VRESECEVYISRPCCLVGSFWFGPSTISATGIVAAMSGGSEVRERMLCSVTKGSFYAWTKSRDHGSLRALENDLKVVTVGNRSPM